MRYLRLVHETRGAMQALPKDKMEALQKAGAPHAAWRSWQNPDRFGLPTGQRPAEIHVRGMSISGPPIDSMATGGLDMQFLLMLKMYPVGALDGQAGSPGEAGSRGTVIGGSRRRARRNPTGRKAGPHRLRSLEAHETTWMEFFTGKARTWALVIIDSPARGFSVPGMMRYHRPDPALTVHQQAEDVAVMVHERWHQVQYREGGRLVSLARLAREQVLSMRGTNVYLYDPARVRTLGDIGHLEGQAQFVEDFVHAYLDVSAGADRRSAELAWRARVLRTSGVNSSAVKEVLDTGGESDRAEGTLARQQVRLRLPP
jgi:hypothetical protein